MGSLPGFGCSGALDPMNTSSELAIKRMVVQAVTVHGDPQRGIIEMVALGVHLGREGQPAVRGSADVLPEKQGRRGPSPTGTRPLSCMTCESQARIRPAFVPAISNPDSDAQRQCYMRQKSLCIF